MAFLAWQDQGPKFQSAWIWLKLGIELDMPIDDSKSHKKIQLNIYIYTEVMSVFVFHLLNKNLKNRFFSKRARYFLVLYTPPKSPRGTLPYPIETSQRQNLVGFLAPWPSVSRFTISTFLRETLTQKIIFTDFLHIH